MADDTITDLDSFNAYVNATQELAKRQQARAFADTYGVSVDEAYRLLSRSQWSMTKAKGQLKGKAT